MGETEQIGPVIQYTQDNRLIAVHTPLGKDELLLQGFRGQEGISQIFSFQLDLVSRRDDIPVAKLIGERVTIEVRTPESPQGYPPTYSTKRYIHGFVSQFAFSGKGERLAYYQAEVVPWLWFLTRSADCRIFQRMTVPDIITKIFKELGFNDFRNQLQGSYAPREYCVQYRETDFNFVSRLMEQYGIFYFFTHERDRHTLVLADSPGTHRPCPNQGQVRYRGFQKTPVEENEVILNLQVRQEMRPGKYSLTDYNFEQPSTNLTASVPSNVRTAGSDQYEIYDYPGEYASKKEGEELARVRMEEEEVSHLVLGGTSSCPTFIPGYTFFLADHYRPDIDRKDYLLTQVEHSASVGASYETGAAGRGEQTYHNQFACIPRSIPYRPVRLTDVPVLRGPQTAVVVGKRGEEIWVDKFGRVKVQFHWDREGRSDDNSSCWVRVSQPWAGKNWGSIWIPRVGQEVIVEFLEGDPDRPIITGRVYNAHQIPPYELPANQTRSGFKSRSSPGGDSSNFNEIRFEDQKGQEEIYVHAERDLKTVVEADESRSVGGSRTTTIDKNEKLTVKEGNRDVDIMKGNDVLFVQQGHREIQVPMGVYRVDGKQVAITAFQDLTLRCGAGTININAAGIITITGPLVRINS